MAMTIKNLMKNGEHSAFANQNWRYDTLDAAATVAASAYFTGDAVNMLRQGDFIYRVTWATAIGHGNGGTISTRGSHIVLTNDGTTVNLSDSTVDLVTDAG